MRSTVIAIVASGGYFVDTMTGRSGRRRSLHTAITAGRTISLRRRLQIRPHSGRINRRAATATRRTANSCRSRHAHIVMLKRLLLLLMVLLLLLRLLMVMMRMVMLQKHHRWWILVAGCHIGIRIGWRLSVRVISAGGAFNGEETKNIEKYRNL